MHISQKSARHQFQFANLRESWRNLRSRWPVQWRSGPGAAAVLDSWSGVTQEERHQLQQCLPDIWNVLIFRSLVAYLMASPLLSCCVEFLALGAEETAPWGKHLPSQRDDLGSTPCNSHAGFNCMQVYNVSSAVPRWEMRPREFSGVLQAS